MSQETEEKQSKGKQLALELLEQGKIEINAKTGKPSIKDIMEKAEISRSYAFQARKEVQRRKQAEEEPLPSEAEVEEVHKEKPKPPPKKEEEKIKKPDEEEEPEEPITYEEIMEELKDFEEMLADGYELCFGPEGITAELLGKKYHRPVKSCRRMARNWTRYLKRRIDPETLQGYDFYILIANHAFFIIPLGVTWLRERRAEAAKKKKEEKEGKGG